MAAFAMVRRNSSDGERRQYVVGCRESKVTAGSTTARPPRVFINEGQVSAGTDRAPWSCCRKVDGVLDWDWQCITSPPWRYSSRHAFVASRLSRRLDAYRLTCHSPANRALCFHHVLCPAARERGPYAGTKHPLAEHSESRHRAIPFCRQVPLSLDAQTTVLASTTVVSRRRSFPSRRTCPLFIRDR
jgi:hypothetical protein